MTKKFFYLAFAVMTAMCMTTACSDDKEEDTPKTSEANLPTPTNASEAVQFTLTTPLASTSTTSAPENAPVLRTIDITESSEVLLELRHPVTKQTFYVKEKATINGNTYTFNGSSVKGYIKVLDGTNLTRSGSSSLEINIIVTISATEVYTFVNGEGKEVTATKEVVLTGDEVLDNLARTWNILGVILDLKNDDIKAYEEWDAVGGVFDLETTVLQEALDQGVNLTEQNDIKRKIKSISFTKSGLFTIDYADGKEDVANWKWANNQKTQFRITLKDKEMGNKFIDNNSKIDFAFNGDLCNMKLSTVFKDSSNKEWNIVLTLKLKS